MIDRIDEEIGIFKEAQDREIENDSEYHKDLCFFGVLKLSYIIVQAVVGKYAYDNDGQILIIEISVEPQRHSQKKALRG